MQPFPPLSGTQPRLIGYAITLLGLLTLLNMVLDYSFSRYHGSGFYWSESLLFSSFWALCLPLWYLQRWLATKAFKWQGLTWATLTVVVLHLLAYPALVWLLSYAFGSFTFAYRQTFFFGLTDYLIKCLFAYGLSAAVWTLWKVPQNRVQANPGLPMDSHVSILVAADRYNRKHILAVADILYFSAQTPFIGLHQAGRKYLQAGTLRALEPKLDSQSFVRIHKSHLVNLRQVVSYQSRHNGDYDLTMSDGALLRVSRSYAKNFRQKLAALPPLTIK